MIRDHEAVNDQALALLEKLGVEAQDNFLSQKLIEDSKGIIDNLSQLRGAEFDKAYASNELAYHKAVNNLVAEAFIPNIENAEVKALFEAGLKIFKQHEDHAAMMAGADKQHRGHWILHEAVGDRVISGCQGGFPFQPYCAH